MGCCQSERALEFDKVPEKEKVFMEAESEYPLSKVPVRELCTELLANDRDRCIPFRNFQRVCKRFSIPLRKMMENSQFTDSIMATPSHFLTEQLLLCSLILCPGTVYEKISIWFDYYDREAMGQLDLRKLKSMLNSLLQVAIEILPYLAVDKVSLSTIESYSQELNTGKKSLVLQYLNSIRNVTPIEIMKAVKQDKSLLFNHPRVLLFKYRKLGEERILSPGSTRDLDSYSESANSEESFVIQVRLSTNEEKSVVLHPDDDLVDVVNNFSERNSLSSQEKIKLLETIHHIQNNLVGS